MIRLETCIAIVLLSALGNTSMAQGPLVSRAGYYEGSAHWGCDYFKDRSAMSMRMESAGDFWFIVNDHGEIRGEGIAKYDFKFGIDWGMSVKMGISVMKVMGASIDPSVTLELDPTTAVQRYTLTGEVVDNQVNLNVDWAEGTKVNLNLVGTVTGNLGANAGGGAGVAASAAVGGNIAAGTVTHTITVDEPISPFGDSKRTVTIKKLSIYGPYMGHLDAAQDTDKTSVKVGGMFVQKIDFARAKEISQLAQRFPEQGEQGDRGGKGSSGDKGDRGETGAGGKDGVDGKEGAKGEKGDTAAIQIRAGQVKAGPGSKITVRFGQPLDVDQYAVALTPGQDAPDGLTVRWSDKSSQGFTILVTAGESAKSPGPKIPIDWVATAVTD